MEEPRNARAVAQDISEYAKLTLDEFKLRMTPIGALTVFFNGVVDRLEAWEKELTRETRCQHPIEGCEAAMHKNAYVILCSKCMCFCLSDEDVWEPFEKTADKPHTWTCSRCDGENPSDRDDCMRCGR